MCHSFAVSKLYSMIKAIFILCISSISALYSQTQLEPGLIDIELEGITNIVTEIVSSPDASKLFMIGTAKKAYLYDVSDKQKASLIWKNTDLGCLKSSAIAKFSADGKYIALQGSLSTSAKIKTVMFSKIPKAWQRTDDMAVLDAMTGKVLLNVNDAYAISISNNTAFISDKDGFKWYNLPDGKEIKKLSIEENEYAAISPSGKYIVESWDADKQAMKEVASVVRRKSELKIAYKAKKLLAIFDAKNMDKPLFISDDEIDVVTNMIFDAEEKYVYFQAQLGGQEHSTNGNLFVFQRVELATGKIDKSYGVKGNLCKTGKNGKVSSLFMGGDIGFLKQIRVQDPQNTDDFSEFKVRIKLFKSASYFSPIAMIDNTTMAYIYNDKHLYLWDYDKLKRFFRKSADASQEELVDKIKDALDLSIEEGDLKKDIAKKGISGDYVMDITVEGPKCSVKTIFCESDESTNIKMQNDLKDILRKTVFNIEIPKERRIKFRHSFQL